MDAKPVLEWIAGLASASDRIIIFPERIGSYPYGSELLNVTYDPLAGELATFAFDDEGAAARKVFLIRNGILVAPNPNASTTCEG